VIWPWPATKDHAAGLLLLPPLGWGGECKEKAETHGSGYGQFNRTAKEANSNNNNTDEQSIQKQRNAWNNSLSPPHPHPAPSMTSQGIKHPVCWASLGQLAQLCTPLPPASCEIIHPIPAEPRTTVVPCLTLVYLSHTGFSSCSSSHLNFQIFSFFYCQLQNHCYCFHVVMC